MSTIRPKTIHVVLMDGTFASLADGRRSSIGRIHRLLRDVARQAPVGTQEGGGTTRPRLRLHYGMGQQWNRWRTVPELLMGRTLERRIVDAYGWLASGYRPGDLIFLLGYSRGAFAVRSLAGMIGRVGLLRAESATERHIRTAWNYYRGGGSPRYLEQFRQRRCQPAVPIRMLGCFDTVMALGVRLPILWMLSEPRFRFHDAHLVSDVEHGFQALALDETRAAFAPILWDDDCQAVRIEQMWFRGAHSDIGGQLRGLEFARPLANIPLVWMLENAEAVGLPLPAGWREGLDCDPEAPSIGSWRFWGKLFLARAPRTAGRHATESLHPGLSPETYDGPALLVGHLAPDTGRKRRLLPFRRRAGPGNGQAVRPDIDEDRDTASASERHGTEVGRA
ncbi:DUF2235 domain-containing protein [Paracoccus sp. YLB-12]|uniref:DUF2235 domain-containing protein n=1 Tax=Paracoccus maritimus TaxID=2933292 RepID=A0ABT2KCZ6_9RHOB|nr:DUF2235 domain-containing protein [Paracoccus sp. YLB-12]MCT4334236.1 DUF2235 domain-containing protein [Paracoccus sp. YLB-12]